MAEPTPEILAAEPLADARWLRLFRVHYRFADGADRSWAVATRQEHPRCISGRFEMPDAVIIVACHRESSRIVVTREYRVALGDYQYAFPAGLVEPGETLEAAARRELFEETGLKAARVLRMSPCLYSSAGMTDESMVLVHVECEGAPSAAGNEASERIEVLLLSPEEAGRLCSDPALKFDAKAWLVLSRFAATGAV